MKSALHIPGVLLALMLASCVSGKKFTTLRVIYDAETPVSPGLAVPFGIMATDKNNRQFLTKGYLGGKFPLNRYHIEMENGSIPDEKKAVLLVDSAENRVLNRSIKILVWPEKKPELKDSIEIPFNYAGILTWDFNGETGADGDDKGGRVLPVRVGGTALSGGKDGENGKEGSPGESLNVYVQKIMDDSFYRRNGYHAWAVTVRTIRGDYARFTYLGEKHGKLILNCNGGNGGEGGDGGKGPDGRDGDANRSPGNGADGGDGGNGGNGGDGGTVTLYLDSSNRDFLDYFEVNNRGGYGGRGGRGGVAGRAGSGGGSGSRAYDGRPGSQGSNGTNGNNGPGVIVVFRPD